MTKAERDGARHNGTSLAWLADQLMADLDAKDAELARIGADKAYLFQANVANEWEERYECQERRIELMNAEIQHLTAENDRLIAIARADEWQARYWAEHDAVADREATIMAERAEVAALRQRAEAAELFRATLERPRGLRSGQCCDPVIDGEICALLLRVEAAEATLEAVKVEISGDANCGRIVELLFYGPLREKEAELRLAHGKIAELEGELAERALGGEGK